MAPVARRIVLTGSESTGKTTLAEALAGHLGTVWVPEFSRAYAESKGGVLTAADVEPIARGQAAAEQAALAGRHGGFVMFDTDLVSTLVYARHYYGMAPSWIEAAIRRYPPALYLLCQIDLAWAADGVRDRPASRAALHTAFRDTLLEFGFNAAEIQGTGPARLASAIDAVNRSI
jgi:NadR type nicotinamide-nucleotide adenylyltransferase